MTPTPTTDSAVSPVRELSDGIYVASKVAHAELWRDLRHFEREPIISTWIDEAGAGESASLEDLWRRCVHEASNAGALIIYRRPDEVLKGAWVELGAALASGVPVFAVGIEEFTVANHAGITHCADLIEARRRARDALSRRSLDTADGVEPVAWVYELATRVSLFSGEASTYHNFDNRLSFEKPDVPEGAIRNLRPLFASRTPNTEMVVPKLDTKTVCDAIEVNTIGGTDDYPVLNVAGLIGDLCHPLPLASPPSPAEVTEQPTHRHVKRGSEYVLIGIGKMQAENWRDMPSPPPSVLIPVDMREVAIYRSVDDGSLWARPREEFEDGRFTPLQLNKKG